MAVLGDGGLVLSIFEAKYLFLLFVVQWDSVTKSYLTNQNRCVDVTWYCTGQSKRDLFVDGCDPFPRQLKDPQLSQAKDSNFHTSQDLQRIVCFSQIFVPSLHYKIFYFTRCYENCIHFISYKYITVIMAKCCSFYNFETSWPIKVYWRTLIAYLARTYVDCICTIRTLFGLVDKKKSRLYKLILIVLPYTALYFTQLTFASIKHLYRTSGVIFFIDYCTAPRDT